MSSNTLYLYSFFNFTHTLLLLLLLNTLRTSHCATVSRHYNGQLSVDYYNKTCPQVEKLVASVTSDLFKTFPATAPATIRLFFHDCFVEGCDASILIASNSGSKELVERDALDNKEIPKEAFDGINRAKYLVEIECPGVVSCADILALSARDFVHLAGGPYYEVMKGRWDGKTSKASHVFGNLPRSNSTIDEILKLFSSKGLTIEDMVILSGAHTIGFSHCKYVLNRIYDNKGIEDIDPRLMKALRMYCPKSGGNEDIIVPFDVTTPFSFDHSYYGNLEAKMGLLLTDQAMFSDPRTKPVVQTLAKDKQKFFQEFGQAMEKMGSIGVKRGRKHGEKRKDCTLHAM